MEENEQNAENAEIIIKYRLVGSVQGVGFRRFLQHAANERQVRGWARNEQDGSLVVLLCGTESTIAEMRRLLLQGPPSAKILTAVELLPDAGDDDSPADFFDMR